MIDDIDAAWKANVGALRQAQSELVQGGLAPAAAARVDAAALKDAKTEEEKAAAIATSRKELAGLTGQYNDARAAEDLQPVLHLPAGQALADSATHLLASIETVSAA